MFKLIFSWNTDYTEKERKKFMLDLIQKSKHQTEKEKMQCLRELNKQIDKGVVVQIIITAKHDK